MNITLTTPDNMPFVVDVEGLQVATIKGMTKVVRIAWPLRPDGDAPVVTVTETTDEINDKIRAAVKREEEERTAQIDTARDLGITIERLDETLRDIRHELSKK